MCVVLRKNDKKANSDSLTSKSICNTHTHTHTLVSILKMFAFFGCGFSYILGLEYRINARVLPFHILKVISGLTVTVLPPSFSSSNKVYSNGGCRRMGKPRYSFKKITACHINTKALKYSHEA